MSDDAGARYGATPWLQRHWDARAAGNFIGGGVGSGLIVFAAASGLDGVPLAAALLAGLAAIGAGLLCVWFEIGRPWRAFNVFARLRTSWMSREAALAALLFPTALAAAAGVPAMRILAFLLACGFLYAQARLVGAARGIPAWRAPLAAPYLVATGLAEGGGGVFLVTAALGTHTGALAWLWISLLLARILVWQAYLQSLAGPATARAAQALARPGRALLWGGTALPLLLAIVDLALPGPAGSLLAVAGAAAIAAGAWTKLALVTRAAYNQGFALPHLPVRGVRHTPASTRSH